MSSLFLLPDIRPLGPLATVLPFAQLFFYETETLIEAPVYDDDGDEMDQPILADVTGLFPNVFLDSTIVYRVQLKDAAGVNVGVDLDPYPSWLTFADFIDSLPYASVPLYRAAGATNDSAAFQAALATGKPVYFPAGQGTGTDGVYLVTTVQFGPGYIPANSVIFGDGASTVIRPVAAGQTMFRILSAVEQTIDNIYIHDLTLYGYAEVEFEEQLALLTMSGVRNVIVERVTFKGPQGDAILLGAGEVPGEVRHNINVVIQDCIFDGINHNNRAAVSIIDCTSFWFERNQVADFTHSSMPGAVNFEPNPEDVYALLNDINVTDNFFRGIAGSVAVVAFPIPSTCAVPTNIRIANNEFSSYAGTGAEIYISMGRVIGATDTISNFVIDNNSGFDGKQTMSINSVRGLTVTGTNTWTEYLQGSTLGFNGTNDLVRDVSYSGSHVLVGSGVSQTGLLVGKASGLTISGYYDRCGQADSASAALSFLTGVTSNTVTMQNITVIGNTLQTAAVIASGHTFTAANNRQYNLQIGTLTNAFVPANPVGVATLVAGVIAVPALGITAGSKVFVNRQTDAGTIGCSYSITRSAGVSFTITSKDSAGATATSDTSVVGYSVAP